MNNEKRLKEVEKRLRNHLNVTRFVLASLPFIATIIIVVYIAWDFLMQYGKIISVIVILSGFFAAAWFGILCMVYIPEDDDEEELIGVAKNLD